jgi:energy-coupling factor transport system ATP-binding protein
MILLEDVYFAYEGIYSALNGVSVQIDDGESVALVGANGAGKTTLIKHFNGLLRPQSGRVILDSIDISKKSVAELSKSIGLVWQNPDHQLFLNTCKEEVLFGLRNLGYNKEEASERCIRTFSRLDLEGFAERSPFTLSGGERKRLALATVLATEPRILALDEPTTGQDAGQKDKLARLLMELNKKGRTVIVVTHDIEFVIEYFPRTIAMSNGQIIADGATNSVLSNDYVIEQCSLAPPQTTIAARALSAIFPNVPQRVTRLSDLEGIVINILGGT